MTDNGTQKGRGMHWAMGKGELRSGTREGEGCTWADGANLEDVAKNDLGAPVCRSVIDWAYLLCAVRPMLRLSHLSHRAVRTEVNEIIHDVEREEYRPLILVQKKLMESEASRPGGDQKVSR